MCGFFLAMVISHEDRMWWTVERAGVVRDVNFMRVELGGLMTNDLHLFWSGSLSRGSIVESLTFMYI